LSLKQSTPPATVEIAEIEWLPPRRPLPPPPMVQPMPFSGEPAEAPTILLPVPEELPLTPEDFDWYDAARAVAGDLRGSPGRRGFEAPAQSDRKLKSRPDGPPPLFEQPLPRVGTTVTTPEGETILWVSDHCFISLGSTSLTMRDFHDARNGIRTCNIGVGKRKPRDDLLDHLKPQSLKLPPAPAPGQSSGQPPGQQ
jgi:hypothetical protein